MSSRHPASRLFQPSVLTLQRGHLANNTTMVQPKHHFATQSSTKDWSAAQYLKFSQQRNRPARDLLEQIPLSAPARIVDIGCGPGNSTELIAERYPNADLSGIDSSPNMIETARKALPNVHFEVADLETYTSDQPADVLFSNAVFQWVAKDQRIPTMQRLVKSLKPNGVFAMQVPDNFTEKSHECMRIVAENGPWASLLAQLHPARAPFQSPQELYDQLKPLCSSVDIWHTYYQHPLDSHEAIVEWVKGTGLRPFIDPLNAEQREGFLEAYLKLLKENYQVSVDGTVLLRYPRLFLVAVKQ